MGLRLDSPSHDQLIHSIVADFRSFLSVRLTLSLSRLMKASRIIQSSRLQMGRMCTNYVTNEILDWDTIMRQQSLLYSTPFLAVFF